MTVYVLNQDIEAHELEILRSSSNKNHQIKNWPEHSVSVPFDASVGLYIVREKSTTLEDERVINLINRGLRIVCVFLEDLRVISELAQKYCSTKIVLAGGGLVEALQGNDQIQQDGSGAPAARNPQKPHNC